MKTCGVCSSATNKARHVMLDFDIVSEIISFEEKGRFGKEKHQNYTKGLESLWIVYHKKQKIQRDICHMI